VNEEDLDRVIEALEEIEGGLMVLRDAALKQAYATCLLAEATFYTANTDHDINQQQRIQKNLDTLSKDLIRRTRE